MAVAILLIGVAAGVTLSVAAWILSASILLAVLAYPVGGTVGCLVAGLGLALCRGRTEAAQRTQYHQRSPVRSAS
jgi:hypothetical protein